MARPEEHESYWNETSEAENIEMGRREARNCAICTLGFGVLFLVILIRSAIEVH